ncbi:uncharacterized protein BYT42DRAFT_545454 [Radiomyces spectabilis]|uniref:uncharacterized protein n=1 Tax=Radiomyces spectabilis TaxID=64574 RepID=UPI00221FB23E|nr:uncharacterized protein BYT42DRAFT_545454 [Radiomyces spectabilis]KAI8381586.1 hypothetical protein BYT42DRAFT_545454 [Radiomyces spectabilis]
MALNILAPCPKKPSSLRFYTNAQDAEMDDACQELRQILASQSRQLVRPIHDHVIVRTDNPLPHDSSFIPLHQAVTHLHVSDTPNRPRSFSVGDQPRKSMNYKVLSMVH